MGEVSSSRILGDFRDWVPGHVVLYSSSRSRLNLVSQPLGRDCCPDSSWGLSRRPGYVEKVKLVWRWVIIILCFGFVFGIPGAYLA